MKNFIAELLVKLAEKEDEANALRIQVDALEIVVTTLLQHMKQEAAAALDSDITATLNKLEPSQKTADHNSELLYNHVKRLFLSPKD
ncbi:anti-adapter protein IraP [Kluyvera intermedia]|uniref:sigma-S stabilization anti-adapter protein IraP n=1 Tax=Kluyvera intermedia TaxID=61648 RepID=UPI001F2CB012|nr:sigma-S stabilization anti-adapter protein IraP [Kluyvera intermedia]EKU4731623.1 anti-adapter protein IraP [Kluyvera ascorbata]MCE9891295.1 anti-adapter protein IraP [Kluyvera intermedia]